MAVRRGINSVLLAFENHPQKIDDGLAVVDDEDAAHARQNYTSRDNRVTPGQCVIEYSRMLIPIA